jgi:hypothetical protein
MRLKVSSEKDVRAYIRQAFWIDSRIPMFKPDGCPCLLGKIVPSEITPETQANEIRFPVTKEEIYIWGVVIGQWLPKLSLDEQNLIKYRHKGSAFNRRWKVIAREHYGHSYKTGDALKVKYFRILKKLYELVR